MLPSVSGEPRFRDCKLYMKASNPRVTLVITLASGIGLPSNQLGINLDEA